MTITQADLDALNTAILGAELEVEMEGRRVKFRSVAELRAAYEHAKSEIAAASPSSRSGHWRYTFSTQRGD